MLIERAISDSAFIALFFLIIFLIFGGVKKLSPNRFNAVYTSFFSTREFNQHLKEEFFLKNAPVFILSVTTSFVLALTFTLISNKSNFYVIPVLALGVIAFFSFKVGITYVLGKVSTTKSKYAKGVYTIEIISIIVLGGLLSLLIPLEIFYSLKKMEGWVLLLVSIIYGVKIVKQFLYSIENKTSLFYIILYFCALEIIPLLTAAKLLELF